MLVLGRYHNQRIIIDHPSGPVVITVVEIQGSHKVRLGIEADPSIAVHREEVWNRDTIRENRK